MNIIESSAELPVKVSYITDEFGVVVTGIAFMDLDVIHLMTNQQVEAERDRIERELKRDREDAEASAYYSNLESRAEMDYINMNRRL